VLAKFWWIPALAVIVLGLIFNWPWWLGSLIAVVAIAAMQLIDIGRTRRAKGTNRPVK